MNPMPAGDGWAPPAWSGPLLAGPGWLWGWAQGLRRRRYSSGRRRSARLDRPVLAVGNLTLGGTGKTPVVALLAEKCLAAGHRPAVLSRGYGGRGSPGVRLVSDGERMLLGPEAAGDEPCLLARLLPGVPVVCHPSRKMAGDWLLRHGLVPDLFILDDGFQHLSLHRDFNLLLLDGRRPFGNGRVFPAGPLREPVAAAQAADAWLITRHDPAAEAAGCLDGLRRLAGQRPLFRARFAPGGVVDTEGRPAGDLSELSGRRVVAFCGLARPGQFFASLVEAGVDPVAAVAFGDHQSYGTAERERLEAAAVGAGATDFLTTAKDLVKLTPGYLSRPVRAVSLRVDLLEGEALPRLVEERLFGRR